MTVQQKSVKSEFKAIRAGKRDSLFVKYADRLLINEHLNRRMVSFQDNKQSPFYRWFKFKEAFSSNLVKYLLKNTDRTKSKNIRILDPFAGAGTTLNVAFENGFSSIGIEILPIGPAILKARLFALQIEPTKFRCYLEKVKRLLSDRPSFCNYRFPHLNITRGAFSEEAEYLISVYMDFLETIDDAKIQFLLWFACFSILEEISYTRKDGQYLRWDYRAGRKIKSRFNKGFIPDFEMAIMDKLNIMLRDIERKNDACPLIVPTMIEGSCLSKLPELETHSVDVIITSPPYANRYDYTRTYALELAFMENDEKDVKRLRQELLSCTVENKSKRKNLLSEYSARGKMDFFNSASQAFNDQKAVREILDLLYEAKEKKELNNNNIPNLIENYLFEMNLVIRELARILKPNGHFFMVNDNVRYHGEEIPVDLILSDFAESAGLKVDYIWFLSKGKGNSSQQMGEHGRRELRKCVYRWSKSNERQTFT